MENHIFNEILLKKGSLVLFLSLLFLTQAGTLSAQELEIPHTFTPGTVISSHDMNENFDQVANKVNLLDSEIDNLLITGGVFWTLAGNNIYYNMGGVGVHSALPWFYYFEDDVTDYWYRTGVEGGSFFIEYDNDQTGDFSANTAKRLFIDNNGNVGIGTTVPISAFHVDGDVDITSNHHLYLHQPNDATTGIIWKNRSYAKMSAAILPVDTNSSARQGIGFFTGDDADSTTDAQLRMIIRRNGYIGIGTTSPQGVLDVNGSIYQRGGVLHADYVFESNYQLETIEEHADYMWINKHLAGIPGITHDENGLEIIEVGSYRRGIVEELEKAHIYIDQLNEILKSQQEQIEKTRNENNELKAEIDQIKTALGL